MSKIGIATVDSYCGAQIFEAIGLDDKVVERCFTGVPARLGGVDLYKLAADVLAHHDAAFANRLPLVANRTSLSHPGFYKFKKDGEYHCLLARRRPRAAKGGQWRRLRGLPRL